jgi:putative ABC transport system permease protein
MIWSISWKNVWRNKLRSLVVMIAVTLGLFAGIFSSALMYGMMKQRIESAISNETSSIQLHNPKYMENNEIQFYISKSDSLENIIESFPEVKAVSKRIKISGMAKTARTGTGVNIYGINPEKEKLVTEIYNKIPDSAELVERGFHSAERISRYLNDSCGSYFENVKRNPVVIGEKLAKKLNVRIRSKIVIAVQQLDGTPTEGAFRVTGIFKTNNTTFDEMNLFVRDIDLQRLTGLDADQTHEIAVLLKDESILNSTQEKFKNRFPALDVMTWQELQPDLGMMTQYMNVMLYIFIVIILLALGFGIVNTMMMVVLERVKELGMLMAVGMNKARVFRMIMLETIFLSITGAILGMAISSIIINHFSESGIDLSRWAGGLEAIGYEAIIYPAINSEFYFGVTVLVILTAVLASIYPALKALKLNPAEAVRSE